MNAWIATLKYQPKISIILPTYNSDIDYLSATINSVKRQSYANWQLCIADDASNDKKLRQFLDELNLEQRIDVAFRDSNEHISVASNTALDMANGEYVTFLDHDDELHEPEELDALDRAVAVGVEDARELAALRGRDLPRLRAREVGDDGRELVGRERAAAVGVELVKVGERALGERRALEQREAHARRLRWTANDAQSTVVLLGGVYDLETDSTGVSLEAERRLGSSFKAQLEVRKQEKAGTGDTLAQALKDEDMVRFRIAYYF